MDNCLFCKIIKGEIPSTEVYSDENCYAFADIDPKAPTHILLIPRVHVNAIHEVTDHQIFSQLMNAATEIVKQENLEENGYRVVINSGEEGGQMVPHLHLHILAGRNLQWPPG